MKRNKLPVITACLIVAGLLAACGGGGNGGGGGGAQDVTVQGMDTFVFDPATLTAQVGQTVNITLNATGALEHSFVIDEFNFKVGPVAGGQNGSGSFTPSSAGTFEFYCDVPGHREAGMVGTLTVSE